MSALDSIRRITLGVVVCFLPLLLFVVARSFA